MKIAIIGAGFTGLAAASKLTKNGQKVTVFESEGKPGGLAIGFKDAAWHWPLEKHYHHLFVSDYVIRNLAKEVGHRIIFKRPKTSVYINSISYQLDSPFGLLSFSKLNLLDRLRVGAVIFYLKISPFWKPLEKITAEEFLKDSMGTSAWRILWEPLFSHKFGRHAGTIPASWFWARIKKRSARLGYPEGGFESLARGIEKEIKKLGGEFFYETPVEEVIKTGEKFLLKTNGGKEYRFDKVICTLPVYLFCKVFKGLPASYTQRLPKLKSLGAVNLVLSLDKQFLKDGTYWLNINSKDFPFLGIIEHTNFMNPKYYGGKRLIYIGNYLESGHKYFQKNAAQLVNEYWPYLKKVNPKFGKSSVKKAFVFKTPFAQPIMPLNYSTLMPKIKTPITGLYLANMEQVYPWDRGTNYAVELGERAADILLSGA